MRTTQAYSLLLRLPHSVVTTQEAAALFKVEKPLAVYLLGQMVRDGLAIRVRRGLWAIADKITPLALSAYLTAPFPSYISLWSALHYHGMITQAPAIIYLVSTGRPRRITTAMGTYQVHKIRPALFGGFDIRTEAKIARPEKALFDTVYVLGIWRKQAVRLPEIELPGGFKRKDVLGWIERIPSRNLRTITRRQVDRVLEHAGLPSPGMRTRTRKPPSARRPGGSRR